MNSYSTTGLPYARTLLSRKPHREQGISLDTCMLIIDDDRTSSLVLSFMLNLRGYGEIRAVRSAARAVAIAANFSPGLVFLDLDLPNTDAMALAHQLRRGVPAKKARLIAVTSQLEHPLREGARLAGIERFLVKPFEQAEVDKILGLPAEQIT